MSNRYRYQITLEAEPDATADESIRALRAALKYVLRCHRLKCTSATTATPATTTPAIREHDRHQAVAKWAQQKYGPGWSLTQDWFALEAEFSKQQSTNNSGAQE